MSTRVVVILRSSKQIAPVPAVDTLGELHPLMSQLGSADGLVTLSSAAAALRVPAVDTLATLRSFLRSYCRVILLPRELPAICRAFHHASRNEVRELVALDQAIAADVRSQSRGAAASARPAGSDPAPGADADAFRQLAAASRRVGRSQLERLRPLRTERVVQRYLDAVRARRAEGWHTLVFGLTLAVYSLPVRQGLLTYARQTLRGFIQAAARPLHLSRTDCRELLESLCAPLPRRLEQIVAETTAETEE